MAKLMAPQFKMYLLYLYYILFSINRPRMVAQLFPNKHQKIPKIAVPAWPLSLLSMRPAIGRFVAKIHADEDCTANYEVFHYHLFDKNKF